jgi:hypothetical protein
MFLPQRKTQILRAIPSIPFPSRYQSMVTTPRCGGLHGENNFLQTHCSCLFVLVIYDFTEATVMAWFLAAVEGVIAISFE